MDFNSELLSRLEAAQLGSPQGSNAGRGRSTRQGAHSASEPPGCSPLSRRVLWPQASGSDSGRAGGCSPGSGSGLPSPRSSAGLLEALLTSDGSPQAAATARAAAFAARAATVHRGSPGSGCGTATPGRWQELPADVWRWVVGGLSHADIKAARLVCADWHSSLSRNVQLLRPRELRCRQVAARWASPAPAGLLASGCASPGRALRFFAPEPARLIYHFLLSRSFPAVQSLELANCRRLQVGLASCGKAKCCSAVLSTAADPALAPACCKEFPQLCAVLTYYM